MKILIALNFAIGFLLAASLIASEKTELAILAGIGLLPGFLGLALVNFIFIFKLWKAKRFWAFAPIATYVASFFLFGFATTLGMNLILKGTPCRPDSFFSKQTKAELTEVADKLISERRDKNFSPEIYSKLNRHSLEPLLVDTNREILVLGYYHYRRWYEYIYSKNGNTNLPEANTGYARPIEKPLGDNWYFRNW